MAAPTSVMKEIHSLLRKADKLFNGQVQILLEDDCEVQCQQEDVAQNDESNFVSFFMRITPNDGLYKNATFKFKVLVDTTTYPGQAPIVQCLTNVYHPNIDTTSTEYLDDNETNICVSLLGEDWSPEAGLEGCVLATLFLFYHPEIDDALSPVCCDFNDWDEFENEVRKSLRGEEIKDGYTFEKLLGDDGDEKDGDEKAKDVEKRSEEKEDVADVVPAGEIEKEEGDKTETKIVREGEVQEDTTVAGMVEALTGDSSYGAGSDAPGTPVDIIITKESELQGPEKVADRNLCKDIVIERTEKECKDVLRNSTPGSFCNISEEAPAVIIALGPESTREVPSEKDKAFAKGYDMRERLNVAAFFRPWVRKFKERLTSIFCKGSRNR